MTAVIVAGVAFWIAIFLLFFAAQGSSPQEFLLGRFEPPPDDLGQWKEVALENLEGQARQHLTAGREHLVREERFLLPGDRAGARYLVHQVRYRDPVSRAIVRVDPEGRVARRRRSAREPS
jgi:hypothetical protein